MSDKPSRLELQAEAGVIELAGILGGIQENIPRLPGYNWPMGRGDFHINRKTASLLRLMGINPAMDVVVGHPDNRSEHTDGVVYTGGYNTEWYFLIKGEDTDDSVFMNGGDYYCCNAVVAPHDNNPEEGRAKIERWFELLKEHGY